MTIKQLERSQKIYSDIKSLDAEIIEIDKVAMLIAEGNAEINLTLNVKDTTPKNDDGDKVEFDEDGSLKTSFGSGMNFRTGIIRPWGNPQSIFEKIYGKGPDAEDKSAGTNLKSSLSDNLSLNVLAILLYDKQEKRAKLIKSLNRIGITI